MAEPARVHFKGSFLSFEGTKCARSSAIEPRVRPFKEGYLFLELIRSGRWDNITYFCHRTETMIAQRRYYFHRKSLADHSTPHSEKNKNFLTNQIRSLHAFKGVIRLARGKHCFVERFPSVDFKFLSDFFVVGSK